jgi:hypothetical protein
MSFDTSGHWPQRCSFRERTFILRTWGCLPLTHDLLSANSCLLETKKRKIELVFVPGVVICGDCGMNAVLYISFT